MKGNWVTTGLRKLNRHYQSESNNEKEFFWDSSKEYLVRMKKDNEYYYPAPWYSYFKNGELVQKLNFSEMQFDEFTENISIYSEKDIEFVPYLPKTSDNFYTNNTKELSFIANEDFDLTITSVSDSNDVHDYVIASYKEGENLNSVTCNLLKLKYDLYVTKKDGFNAYTDDELFDIYNKLYSKVKCSGKPEFSLTYDSYNANSFFGLFSASVDPQSEQQLKFLSGMPGNFGYNTYDDNHSGYAVSGLYPQYISFNYWNGEQRINKMYSGPLFRNLSNIKVGGFYASDKYEIDSTSIYSGLYNACFKTWYILREIDTWKGAVTG